MARMNLSLLADSTGHSHLRRLVILRSIAVLAQIATLALVYRFLDMALTWLPMMATIAALAALNLLSWWRLRAARPVSNPELFAQLCADVLALSVLLYYGGGSTNPFVSLFLLPLVIAAATLPGRYTWLMAGLTTACYTLLMEFYVPLPMGHESMDHSMMGHDMSGMEGMAGHDMAMMDMSATPDSAFNMHVFGMWLGFVISAAVVAYFVVRMAQAVRERDEALARIREETLRNERVVALGLQAASAAHEMGTPLSTLAVVIGELQGAADALPEWREDLALLDGQVRNCRRILDKMLASAQDTASDTARIELIDQFLRETLDEWQLLRPTVHCKYTQTTLSAAPPPLVFNPALRAALLNLLNNAADASPEKIAVHARWDARQLVLEVLDYGSGLTPEAANRAGSAFFTTKQEGRGLGLFLANTSIERLGGKVRLFNRTEGGATTEVTLPLGAST
ncbi:Sensor histidine kinase RegB [Ferriphaselus amnicola]|uniref:histidine kinase n=2 Tax=Ferriphaselus amnicola TaxID=1188319 RepID=A0A2Z6GF78_9PROT|nr:Sensor histidine kinase RegB [Ferriphaselus amnicola]